MENIIISDEAYKHDGGAPILLLAGPVRQTYQLAKRIQYLTSERVLMLMKLQLLLLPQSGQRYAREVRKTWSNEYRSYSKT